MDRWARFNYTPCLPIGEDGRRVTGCLEHIELSRRAAAEGTVLLKNENGLLPLKHGTRVAVFGKAQYDYVKGGGGSGEVNTEYVRNIYDGLKIKHNEGKISLYDGLIDFYKTEVEKQYIRGCSGLLQRTAGQARQACFRACSICQDTVNRAGRQKMRIC